VGDELALVVGGEERERALIVPNREATLERRARGGRGFEIVDGRCFARVATRQVPRQDRRREPLGQGPLGQVFAELAVHAYALEGVEGNVSDVAGERITEVDVVAFLVAEAAREESRERLLVVERGQGDDVVHAQRSARDRQPIDDQVLDRRQLLETVGDELFEGRGERLASLSGAFDPEESVLPVARLADLERPPLEQ